MTQETKDKDNKAKAETDVIIVEDEQDRHEVNGTTKPLTPPKRSHVHPGDVSGDNTAKLVIVADDDLPPLVHPRRLGNGGPEGVNTESGSVGYNSIIPHSRAEPTNGVGGRSGPVAARRDRCGHPPGAVTAHAMIHPYPPAAAHPVSPSTRPQPPSAACCVGDVDQASLPSLVGTGRDGEPHHPDPNPSLSPTPLHGHHPRHHYHHDHSPSVSNVPTGPCSPRYQNVHPHRSPSCQAARPPSRTYSQGSSAKTDGPGSPTGSGDGGGGGRRPHATVNGSPLGRVYLMKRTPQSGGGKLSPTPHHGSGHGRLGEVGKGRCRKSGEVLFAGQGRLASDDTAASAPALSESRGNGDFCQTSPCASRESGLISPCVSWKTGQISSSSVCDETSCGAAPSVQSVFLGQKPGCVGSSSSRGTVEGENEVDTEDRFEGMGATDTLNGKESEPSEGTKGLGKDRYEAEGTGNLKRKTGQHSEEEGKKEDGGGKKPRTEAKGDPCVWETERGGEDAGGDEWSLLPLVKRRRGKPREPPSWGGQGAADNESAAETRGREVWERPWGGSPHGRLLPPTPTTTATASAADVGPSGSSASTTITSASTPSSPSPSCPLPSQSAVPCRPGTSINQAAWNQGSLSSGNYSICNNKNSDRRSAVQSRDNSPIRGDFTSLSRGKQFSSTGQDNSPIQVPPSSSSSSSRRAVEIVGEPLTKNAFPFWISSRHNEDDSSASLSGGHPRGLSSLSSSSLEAAELSESHLVSAFVTGSSDGEGCGGEDRPSSVSPHSPALPSCLGDPPRPQDEGQEMDITPPAVFQSSQSSPPLPAPPFPGYRGNLDVEDADGRQEKQRHKERKTLQSDVISSSFSYYRPSCSTKRGEKTLQPGPAPVSPSSPRSASKVGHSPETAEQRLEESDELPDLDSWCEDRAKDSISRRRQEEREATQQPWGNHSVEEEEEEEEEDALSQVMRSRPPSFTSPVTSSDPGTQPGGKIAQIAAVLPQMTAGKIAAALRRFDGDVERCVIALLDGDLRD